MRVVSGTARHDGSWLPAMVPCLTETSLSVWTQFVYHAKIHPRRPSDTTWSRTGYVYRNFVNPHSVPLLSVEPPSSTNQLKQEPVWDLNLWPGMMRQWQITNVQGGGRWQNGSVRGRGYSKTWPGAELTRPSPSNQQITTQRQIVFASPRI